MEHDYDGVMVRVPGPMHPDLFDGESPILQDVTVYGFNVEATFFRNPEQQRDGETPAISRGRTIAATSREGAREIMGGGVREEYPRACAMEFEVEDEECTCAMAAAYVERAWATHRAARPSELGKAA